MRTLVITLIASTVVAGVARADKFTHTADVRPNVTLSERARPIPKHDAPVAPPSGTELLQVEGLLGTIHTEQIAILEEELIPNTPDSNVDEKADYYFRLGEIYAKLHRFHRLEAIRLELAKGDPKAIASHREQARRALVDTVRTYKRLVYDPIYVNAPKVDVALFYLAYTLQSGGKLKAARDAYDRLLKNYPRSKYIPDAHFAFAEYHFEAGELADAEARYRMVLKFPASSVFHHAQYKLGWVAYDQRKFGDAMQAFNDVVQATRRDSKLAILHRAATRDFVRAYAEIGKADKALLAFRRVSRGDGIGMLETLADLYLDKGMSEKAIFVLRQLMTERPTSPKVCEWEHSVARAMLTAGSLDERVGEIEKLVALYRAVHARLPRAAATECRESAAEMSGMYAKAFHQEGAKTKNADLLRVAGRLYRSYLDGFPGAKDRAEMLYYRAELAWLFAELERDRRLATEKWSAAADAFTQAIERGKLSPKLVQISADAAMLARMKELQVDPRLHHEAVADTEYDKVATPKPIPPQEQKLLAAYDGYLKHVRDPKDDERIDVMFHRANLLRRYDHFAEALPVLEAIVLEHPGHETAPWSAQLALDSYNRLKNYDSMFAFIDKVPAATVAKWPEVEATIKTLRHQRIGKQAHELAQVADRTKDPSKFVACGAKYLEAYNDDPMADKADVLLYDAGVCYEQGKSISAAIGMYQLLQQLFPKSKLAAKSLARLGDVYASIAYYKEAADKLEEYAVKYGGEDNAYPALSDAVQFRKGIGDDAKAVADTQLFIKMFGRTRRAEAAAAFFSMISIYEKQGDRDKLAAHLRAYVSQFGAIGGADRRVIASAKLGQTLWDAACPVPTIDGTCMKMKRVASLAGGRKLRSEGVPRRCGDETTAELVIVPRDARKVRAAIAAWSSAIAEYERAKPLTGDTRGALYHYSVAKFGLVERDYERYLAMEIPSNLSFDKRQPAVAARSRKRFETWFGGKRDLGVSMRSRYEQIIGLKDGAMAIAAAARLGAVSQNFSAQLFRAEIPADQRTGPYAEDTAQAYCDELEKLANPLQLDAQASYQGCLSTSTRLGWFSEWSRACERELGQLMPDRYPKAFELRGNPDEAAAIVDVERPVQL